MDSSPPLLSDADILLARPPKHDVDPEKPYAFFSEQERAADGRLVNVATIFLTNRECPFRCLMCDLWKNTTDKSVPPGAIATQIDFALERLPPAHQVKLYNSGNFFDAQAIPTSDLPSIAARVRHFENVIIENHPKLTNEKCLRFRDQLGTGLEVAMGLETVHPQVLASLNKQMTVADFDDAARFLVNNGIALRSFILLKPPPLDEAEGIEWAIQSVEHAFSVGVGCCAVIPTRAGNGIMEQLQSSGQFTPPRLGSLERVFEAGLRLRGGRVVVDVWDAEQFAACPACQTQRIERLRQMNLAQAILAPVQCNQCERHDA